MEKMHLFLTHLGLELVPMTSAHLPLVRACDMAAYNCKNDEEIQSSNYAALLSVTKKGENGSVGSLADLYAPVQNAVLQGPATPGDFDVGGPNIAVKGMSFELSEI